MPGIRGETVALQTLSDLDNNLLTPVCALSGARWMLWRLYGSNYQLKWLYRRGDQFGAAIPVWLSLSSIKIVSLHAQVCDLEQMNLLERHRVHLRQRW